MADPRPARRDHRPAVLPAVDDEPAGAGVVRARASRREPVPAVRAVESRVDAGARRLSVPARAVGADAHAGARLVGRLCALRRPVRRRRAGRACRRRARRQSLPLRRRRAPAIGDRPRRAAADAAARQVLWCTLAATGSLLLLAVSNHITQNIASIPLLWIAPLAIYLLTFILCFDASGWYRRDIFLPMLAAGLGVMAWTLADPKLTHELEIADRRVLRRALPRVHVLPRRARAAEARAELPDAVLSDDLARRRRRLGAGRDRRAARAARVFRAGRRPRRCARCCSLWQVRRQHAVFGCSRRAAVVATVGCGVWAVREFYDDVIVATRNFYGVLRVTEWGARRARTIAARSSTARSCTARSSSRRTSRRQADDLLHARPPASAGCSSRCIRAWIRSSRRDRPRHRDDRDLRREGRRLPLLRHQPGRDRHRAARLHVSRRQRCDDRAARWATRGCRSSASRRRISTCWRSTPSRATPSRCT